MWKQFGTADDRDDLTSSMGPCVEAAQGGSYLHACPSGAGHDVTLTRPGRSCMNIPKKSGLPAEKRVAWRRGLSEVGECTIDVSIVAWYAVDTDKDESDSTLRSEGSDEGRRE